MKRLLFVVMAALAVAGCGGSSNEPEGPKAVTVSLGGTSSLSFEASSPSPKTVSLTADGKWTATKTDSWFSVDPSSGSGSATLTVTVGNNTSSSSRSGSIFFKGENSTSSVSLSVSQAGYEATGPVALAASPAAFDGTKRSSTTYQLLVYSFADGNGDGIGDFKGIESKLDYLDGLGVTALWLSPIHPSDSYHGYDVKDYFTVNPDFGTESDFKSLIDKAHAKGIKIYIDYVLNHSGKGNAWFQEALADASSPYRDFYFMSANPSADYSSFPMLAGTTYVSSEWKQATSGSPKLTITKTDEAVTSGTSGWNLWLWKSGQDGKPVYFKDAGGGKLYLVTELSGSYGMLVRKYDNWNAGSKFGAGSGGSVLSEGSPLSLAADGGDISFSGTGRYRIELSDISTETLYYMGAFSDWMPDLNYGAIASCEDNATFKELASSADKWIKLGIDGLRLDAVKHICGGISSYNNAANRTFLEKWFAHCNATYKAAGHNDDIFMVGEVWSSHAEEKLYYSGLTSCFEFGYWPLLCSALNSGNAASYVTTVTGFISDHKAVRPDAQTSLFMTNHDDSSQTGDGQLRAADDLGKSLAREKQAAAMILTTEGKPFIYQGEELGYWGKAGDGSDEYNRAPIMWDKAGSDVAKGYLGGKVDASMLTSSISVEAQGSDENSLLGTYKYFSRIRNTYPALASGQMSRASVSGSSIAAWYMTSGSQKLLVVHNVASASATVTVQDDMSRPVALLGGGSVEGKKLTLDGNSSVVFELQ